MCFRQQLGSWPGASVEAFRPRASKISHNRPAGHQPAVKSENRPSAMRLAEAMMGVKALRARPAVALGGTVEEKFDQVMQHACSPASRWRRATAGRLVVAESRILLCGRPPVLTYVTPALSSRARFPDTGRSPLHPPSKAAGDGLQLFSTIPSKTLGPYPPVRGFVFIQVPDAKHLPVLDKS